MNALTGLRGLSGMMRLAGVSVAPPAAPTDLGGEVAGPTQVAIFWTDNSDNEDDFEVQRSLDQVDWDIVAVIAVNTTVHYDNSVVAGNGYYYRVRARNAGGMSEWSNTAGSFHPSDE